MSDYNNENLEEPVEQESRIKRVTSSAKEEAKARIKACAKNAVRNKITPNKNIATKATENVTKKAVNEAGKKASAKVAQKATSEAAKKVAGNGVKKIANNTVKKATTEVAKQAAKKVATRVATKTALGVGGRAITGPLWFWGSIIVLSILLIFYAVFIFALMAPLLSGGTSQCGGNSDAQIKEQLTQYGTPEDVARFDELVKDKAPTGCIGNGEWVLPIDDVRLITNFVGPREPILTPGGWTNATHRGTDLVGTIGQAVYAMSGGTVTNNNTSGCGVTIDHGNGYVTRYLHLETDNPWVKVGEQVKAGQKIGTMQNTCTTTGAHVHLEVDYKDATYLQITSVLFEGGIDITGAYPRGTTDPNLVNGRKQICNQYGSAMIMCR